jgi:hypothetical protein
VSHNDFFANGGGGGASIYIKNIYLGGTVNVNDNACVMPIYVDPANNAGHINIGQQKIGNGIYYVRGKTVLPDHADTITTTYESQYGEVGVYAWPAIATWGIQPVARVMSTSSPLPGLSAVASATGITLTVPASPVHADTTVFWEVIAVPVIEYAH